MINKKLTLSLMSTAFLLCACQFNPNSNVSKPKMKETELSTYIWKYFPKNQVDVVEIDFEPKGDLYIKTPCNGQSGSWKQQDAAHIVTSNLASTLKMCEPAKMQLEKWSSQLFSNQQLSYSISGANDSPTLTVTDAKGQQYQFSGVLKPEVKYQTEAQLVFFEVAPAFEQCKGNQQCVRAREVRYDQNGIKQPTTNTWIVFEKPIEGYQHDPKVAEIIRVKKYAAAQGDVYIYDMTVEQSTSK